MTQKKDNYIAEFILAVGVFSGIVTIFGPIHRNDPRFSFSIFIFISIFASIVHLYLRKYPKGNLNGLPKRFLVYLGLILVYFLYVPVIYLLNPTTEYSLDIYLNAYDPRFYAEGEKRGVNWGGGSQSLFLETNEPVPTDLYGSNYENSQASLLTILNSGSKITAWEVLYPPRRYIRLYIDAIYNANADKNRPCRIESWGVKVEEVKRPDKGFFTWYRAVGGASGEPHGGFTKIRPKSGIYSIQWDKEVETSNDVNSSSYYYVLKPGEPVRLDLRIESEEFSEFRDIFLVKDDPDKIWLPILSNRSKSFHMSVYANARIDGKSKTYWSDNRLRVITPDASTNKKVSKSGFSDDSIEDLRPKAYF